MQQLSRTIRWRLISSERAQVVFPLELYACGVPVFWSGCSDGGGACKLLNVYGVLGVDNKATLSLSLAIGL
jgi:hypothetical protein